MLTAPPERSREAQIAWEVQRRARVAVPAIAAGVLYELSSVTLSAVLKTAPTVGVVQAITPALNGVANPTRSPATDFVRYLSHHAFGQIAGSAMAAISVVLAVLALSFLYDAARFRRPETWPGARPLLMIGGGAYALLSVTREVVQAITTHSFAVGHNFSIRAVDHALTANPAQQVITYASLLAALALAVGIVATCLNAMRVGLISRPMGYGGFVVGVLFVLPLPLQILIALWMLLLGILLLGRWPRGDPPAWAAGEARPWPTAADLRAQRTAAGGGGGRGARGARGADSSRAAQKDQAAAPATDGPPEPTRPAQPSAAKRKRKRGARR
jgi:hypothetical protein